MSYNILKIALLLISISLSSGQGTHNLHCNFRISPDNNYDCLINQAVTLNDQNVNIGFVGVHQTGRSNGHVTRIMITNSFMPLVVREAGTVFPLLRTYSFTTASSNNVKTMQSRAFQNASLLQEISITHAGLMVVIATSLQGAQNLRSVNLEHNQISYVPIGLLTGLPNLQIINLSNNRLAYLPDNFFAGVPTVTNINLNRNQLARLPQLFNTAPAPAINQLHAENNLINSAFTTLLTGWNALTTLNLIGNRCINQNFVVGGAVNIGTINAALNQCFLNPPF